MTKHDIKFLPTYFMLTFSGSDGDKITLTIDENSRKREGGDSTVMRGSMLSPQLFKTKPLMCSLGSKCQILFGNFA